MEVVEGVLFVLKQAWSAFFLVFLLQLALRSRQSGDDGTRRRSFFTSRWFMGLIMVLMLVGAAQVISEAFADIFAR